jgi:DNA-binding MarR family transcriptional regulator
MACAPFYTAETFRPRNSIGYLVKRVSKLAHAQLEEAFIDRDISFTQWVVLALLCSGIADTAGEIARDIGHDPGAMTRIIDQLEARGLVERRRDPADRRILKLAMTADGRRLFDSLTPTIMNMWNDLLSGFAVADINLFISMLHRLVAKLEGADSVRAGGAIDAE